MCLLGSPGKGSMWQQELGGCMSWAESLGRCCPSAGNAELRRDFPKTVDWEWLLALAKSPWVVVMFGQHLGLGHSVLQAWHGAAGWLSSWKSPTCWGCSLFCAARQWGGHHPIFLPLPLCDTSCPGAMALGYQLCPVCSGTNESWACCHLLFEFVLEKYRTTDSPSLPVPSLLVGYASLVLACPACWAPWIRSCPGPPAPQ